MRWFVDSMYALAAAEEGGGVDQLDGVGQVAEAGVHVLVVVRDHLRGVDPGERLVEGVLQKARGAHRQRHADVLDEVAQVAHQGRRQAGLQEAAGDAPVGGLVGGKLQQVVLPDEGVEDIGADHQRFGDGQGDVREAVLGDVAGEDLVDEGQAARFAADGAAAQPHESMVSLVAFPRVPHQAALLGLPLAVGPGPVDGPAEFGPVGAVPHGGFGQAGGERQLRPGQQPAAELAPGDGRPQHLLRQAVEHGQEHRQIGDPLDGLPVGVPQRQVAESELVAQGVLEVGEEGLAGFQQVADLEPTRRLGPAVLAGLDQHRQVGLLAADPGHEVQSGRRVERSRPGEAHVGDDPQEVVLELLVDRQRLLVSGGQVHLGPGSLAQRALGEGQVLLEQPVGLMPQLVEQQRQVRGVEKRRVLNHQQVLHARPAGVGGGVLPVLDVLDDPHQDLAVALPDEDAVHGGGVGQLHQPLQLGGVEGQEHHRQVRARAPLPCARR